jgi:alginate O-acetyltransferase complex protein AlgI
MFAFLPVVLLIYYILPKKFRNFFLLIADLFFYGWGEPILVLLMVFSIVINYIAGLLIGKTDNNKRKKAILIVSVIIDLGLLAFFKYAGFITENLKIILPFLNIKVLEIPLPIGISFYTFQIMSYTIDVYSGDTQVQKNLISFGTYVSLFPQLIAGPIVRYRDVDAQLSERHESADQFARGVRLFMLGLCKKILFANPMGLLWDTMRATEGRGALASWIGIIAYSLQIYFDFSGYSDMAIGLARVSGFTFDENFTYPYCAQSVTAFWRRWHISLGMWFRNYVYIPLGGSRAGQGKTVRNIIIVWLLTGLWHGANWTFLIWGAYHAALLLAEKFLFADLKKKLPAAVNTALTFFVVVLGWVPFF